MKFFSKLAEHPKSMTLSHGVSIVSKELYFVVLYPFKFATLAFGFVKEMFDFYLVISIIFKCYSIV